MKPGDWILIRHATKGDVAAVQVESIDGDVASTSDGGTWNLRRPPAGYSVVPLEPQRVPSMIYRILERNRVPRETLCVVLGILLQTEERT